MFLMTISTNFKLILQMHEIIFDNLHVFSIFSSRECYQWLPLKHDWMSNLLMAASHASEPSFDTSSPSTSLTFSYARFTSCIAFASAGSSSASGLVSSSSTVLGGPPGLGGDAWLTAGGWRTRTMTARSCSCCRRNLKWYTLEFCQLQVS